MERESLSECGNGEYNSSELENAPCANISSSYDVFPDGDAASTSVSSSSSLSATAASSPPATITHNHSGNGAETQSGSERVKSFYSTQKSVSTFDVSDAALTSVDSLQVSSTHTLAFAQQIVFKPVLNSRLLRSIGEKSWYYPALSVWLIFTIIIVHLTSLSSVVQSPLLFVCIVGVAAICAVELTRVDKYLLGRLVLCFEYWLLIGNTLAIVITVFYTQIVAESVDFGSMVASALGNLLLLMGSLYSFSLDAIVRCNPRLKLIVLTLLLVNELYVFLHQAVVPETEVSICLFYCANNRSIISSSELTIIFFMFKYIVRCIRRPTSLIIISPTYLVEYQVAPSSSSNTDA